MKGNRKRVMQKKGSGFRLGPVALCLLFAAVVATPAFFLLGYIYNRFLMAMRQRHLKNNEYDFWLTPEQSMAYLKKTNRYNEVKKLLLSARGDAKSVAYDEYRPELNSLTRELEQLRSFPMKEWKQFREVVARTNAFLFCLITWCAVILYFHLPLDGHTIGTIMDQYSRLALYLPSLVSADNPQPLEHEWIWAIANATLWPILLYFPIKQLAGTLAYFYTKRPAKVDFGSVATALDHGHVKTAFVASAPRNIEALIETMDESLEPEMWRSQLSPDAAGKPVDGRGPGISRSITD